MQAKYYKRKENHIFCELCPRGCFIGEGEVGFCRGRRALDGKLILENFGKVASLCIDPIEKKPLYHFYPGSEILSIGSYGCNLSCLFCQNHSLAHGKPTTEYISPREINKIVGLDRRSIGIAFTYNEPIIWYEYVLESAKLIKENFKDKKIVLVTNGYINKEPLEELLPYVDAMNIDLKSYRDSFYKGICGGMLEPIKQTIINSYGRCHIEITNLVVNGSNDSIEEIRDIADFISKIDKSIPLHLPRYFKAYKMLAENTPIATMHNAKKIAKSYLEHVYLGNMP